MAVERQTLLGGIVTRRGHSDHCERIYAVGLRSALDREERSPCRRAPRWSAHTEGELAALTAMARDKITAGQQPLDLGLDPESQVRASGDAVVRRHSSQLL